MVLRPGSLLILAQCLGCGSALQALPAVHILNNHTQSEWILTNLDPSGFSADPSSSLEVEHALPVAQEVKEVKEGSGPATPPTQWLVPPRATVILRLESARPGSNLAFNAQRIGDPRRQAFRSLYFLAHSFRHGDEPGASTERPVATHNLTFDGPFSTSAMPVAFWLDRAKEQAPAGARKRVRTPPAHGEGLRRPAGPVVARAPGASSSLGSGSGPGQEGPLPPPSLCLLPSPAPAPEVPAETLITRTPEGRFRLNPTPDLIHEMRRDIEFSSRFPWAREEEAAVLGDIMGFQGTLFKLGDRTDSRGLAILACGASIGKATRGPIVRYGAPAVHDCERFLIVNRHGFHTLLRPAEPGETPGFSAPDGRNYVEVTRVEVGPDGTHRAVPVIPRDEHSLAAAIFYRKTNKPLDPTYRAWIRQHLASSLPEAAIVRWMTGPVEAALNAGQGHGGPHDGLIPGLEHAPFSTCWLNRDPSFQNAVARSGREPARPVRRLVEPGPGGRWVVTPTEAIKTALRADMGSSRMFLGLDEAYLLGDLMGIQTVVLVTHPQDEQAEVRLIEPGTRIGTGEPLEHPSGLRILFVAEQRHYTVIAPNAGTLDPARYRTADGTTYAEVTHFVVDRKGDLRCTPVIGKDGHCLIASIHYLQTLNTIRPEKIQLYRILLAVKLTDDQITELASSIVTDLLQEVREASESGCYSGLGPRLSEALTADPSFLEPYQARWDRRVEEQKSILANILEDGVA